MKLCRDVANHPAMQPLKVKPLFPKFPGCEDYEINDDCYLECLTRHLTHTFWHPVGTARMGDPDDPASVVDTELR